MLFLLLLLPHLTTAATTDTEKNCNCYRTSANSLFLHHRFWDFRSVSLGSGVPTLSSRLPSTADDETGQSSSDIGELQDDGYIASEKWTDSWSIQDWGKGKTDDTAYRMWNSLSNVFIDSQGEDEDEDEDGKTMLVLRTKRFSGWQSSGEVESLLTDVMYASTRIRARVRGSSGAVAGLFWYRNGRNESDIEILTRDERSQIRYSNQPVVDGEGNEIEDASTLVDFNTDERIDGTELNDKRDLARRESDIEWSDWHTHRIDWVEGKSSWYIDGEHLLDKTYGVPTLPSYFIMNMWSDGGVWSGEMEVGKEARLEIEWVEMVFNKSDQRFPDEKGHHDKRDSENGNCANICTIDDKGNEGVLNGEIPSSAVGLWEGGYRWSVMALGMFLGQLLWDTV